jgi:hypothetical protein
MALVQGVELLTTTCVLAQILRGYYLYTFILDLPKPEKGSWRKPKSKTRGREKGAVIHVRGATR